MLTLDALLSDESLRQQEFPVIKDSLFLAHAGVTILPRRVTRTMQDYLEQCSLRMQEYPEAWRAVNETRSARSSSPRSRSSGARAARCAGSSLKPPAAAASA
jgi:hypothetical protein